MSRIEKEKGGGEEERKEIVSFESEIGQTENQRVIWGERYTERNLAL